MVNPEHLEGAAGSGRRLMEEMRYLLCIPGNRRIAPAPLRGLRAAGNDGGRLLRPGQPWLAQQAGGCGNGARACAKGSSLRLRAADLLGVTRPPRSKGEREDSKL
jgi:hypothetical protein